MLTAKTEKRLMNNIATMLKKVIACVCSAALLLCGCKGTVRSDVRTSKEETIKSELKICCSSYYGHALERVIRTLNSHYGSIDISLISDRDAADILITDRMDDKTAERFISLDSLTGIADFIPELLFRRGDEVIGLPLFLETDGIWLDRLPYLRENADAPCRFDDAVSSDFIKSNPMLYSAQSDSIYWGIIVPMYISCGGSADSVSAGVLSGQALSQSLERLMEMAENGIIRESDNPSSEFTAGKAAGWICSYLDIIKIQQDMPLSSKLVFAPGISAYKGETINLAVRADTLFVSESADKQAAEIFIGQLFEESSLLSLISDTHLPIAAKISCKNHSLPEIFREFYSVLSSTAVKITYITDRRSESAADNISSIIKNALDSQRQ